MLAHYKGRSYKDLQKMVNQQFGLELTFNQIKRFMAQNGLKNGRNTQFKPGQVSHNKGKKGISYAGMKATQFKPGRMPHNWLPVGSETIDTDGYAKIKTADPKTWEFKHTFIWEQHNGLVPRGSVVIFGDGDKSNFDLDNLILVTRAQLAQLNKHGLIKNDAAITRAGVAIVDLKRKIRERAK